MSDPSNRPGPGGRSHALHRAIVVGTGLSIASLTVAVLLWVEALRRPGGWAVFQALLVTAAAALFSGLTARARRLK